jgi:hypothetical protein
VLDPKGVPLWIGDAPPRGEGGGVVSGVVSGGHSDTRAPAQRRGRYTALPASRSRPSVVASAVGSEMVAVLNALHNAAHLAKWRYLSFACSEMMAVSTIVRATSAARGRSRGRVRATSTARAGGGQFQGIAAVPVRPSTVGSSMAAPSMRCARSAYQHAEVAAPSDWGSGGGGEAEGRSPAPLHALQRRLVSWRLSPCEAWQ